MWTRDFSEEAIASALAPRTQTWFRGEGRKIPPEDAAMAMAGVEPLAAAFLRVSWGEGSLEDVAICKRYLMGAAAWEAEAESWPDGRLDRLVAMVLDEIQHGHPVHETTHAHDFHVSEQWWHKRWRARYRRILADAFAQVSRAHEHIARRVS